MWQWASISPGITVLPAASIRIGVGRAAPSSTLAGRTSAIRLPSIKTSTPRRGAFPMPSMTSQFSITIADIDGLASFRRHGQRGHLDQELRLNQAVNY